MRPASHPSEVILNSFVESLLGSGSQSVPKAWLRAEPGVMAKNEVPCNNYVIEKFIGGRERERS